MSSPRPGGMPTNVSPIGSPTTDAGGVASIRKTLSILELVAERGGATAKEVSEALGLPTATVYRLMGNLVDTEYLVHLKNERRFELGYKLHQLGVSLHRQVGVPAQVKAQIAQLHERTQTAAYFAVYRGADVIVAYVDDCPEHPRLQPLNFGMHEASHATAFGKVLLAGMASEQRTHYLDIHGTPPLTPTTMTRRDELEDRLRDVAMTGIAWEREEFVPGQTCAAIGIRNGSGTIVGSVAISVPTWKLKDRERELEKELRTTASHLSRYFRTGKAALATE